MKASGRQLSSVSVDRRILSLGSRLQEAADGNGLVPAEPKVGIASGTDRKQQLESLSSLVSPFGIVASTSRVSNPWAPHRLQHWCAVINSGCPGLSVPANRTTPLVTPSGRALDDPEAARLIAIAEGAERYAAADFPSESRIWSSAAELDGPTIDLNAIPRCSEREYGTPGCPLRPFDPQARIRWDKGFDLVAREETWVPAVMACYRLRNKLRAENFWYPISTGFAVHFDPAEAAVRAICEVIERDAVAITWLQRLPLPLVADEDLSSSTRYLRDWSTSHFIDTYLLDATTDLGVPTVYCLQVAEHDERAHHAVGCAAARSIAAAADKAIMETLLIRGSFYVGDEDTQNEPDPSDPRSTARYTVNAGKSDAFQFLTHDASSRTSIDREPLPEDSTLALERLIDNFAEKSIQPIIIDHTPRELGPVGMTAVNVVIPHLQPMSLNPLAQFRGHSRLYEAPVKMGYEANSEKNLNPWPQPFI
jgi:ribosomal protein S12 methylthiotransferase accessory factor